MVLPGQSSVEAINQVMQRVRAGVVEPPTGHSTKAAPLARTFGASSLGTFGGTVLISMKSLPLVLPASRPWAP